MPGSKKAGICSLNGNFLVGVPHPESSKLNCKLLSVNDI